MSYFILHPIRSPGSHLPWYYVWRRSSDGGCRCLHCKGTSPFCNEYVNCGVTLGHHPDILFLNNISPNIFSIHCGAFPQLFIFSIYWATYYVLGSLLRVCSAWPMVPFQLQSQQWWVEFSYSSTLSLLLLSHLSWVWLSLLQSASSILYIYIYIYSSTWTLWSSLQHVGSFYLQYGGFLAVAHKLLIEARGI